MTKPTPRHMSQSFGCPNLQESSVVEVEFKEVKPNYPSASEVLDGETLSKDLHMLMGYCLSLGHTESVMPSEHFIELGKEFLRKWY